VPLISKQNRSEEQDGAVQSAGEVWTAMHEVTQLLNAIERGEAQAAGRLLPLVYDELRKLAAQKLAREAPGQTLAATALVHEAYLRLAAGGEHGWDSRGHFFAAAAEAMRRILVENARRKKRLKHGGGRQRVPLEGVVAPMDRLSDDLEALDEALTRLAAEDPLKARLVELRFFAGLSVEDAGRCLGISRATADRWWAYARAWLYEKVRDGEKSERE
jgi:RNA polymerase sigma factor (TIGR02999 family)